MTIEKIKLEITDNLLKILHYSNKNVSNCLYDFIDRVNIKKELKRRGIKYE